VFVQILACSGGGEPFAATQWRGTVAVEGGSYHGADIERYGGTCADKSKSRRQRVQRSMCFSGCAGAHHGSPSEERESARASCERACRSGLAELSCTDITLEPRSWSCLDVFIVH
jgi:hypothetical protein